jgi:hypothetical protein
LAFSNRNVSRCRQTLQIGSGGARPLGMQVSQQMQELRVPGDAATGQGLKPHRDFPNPGPTEQSADAAAIANSRVELGVGRRHGEHVHKIAAFEQGSEHQARSATGPQAARNDNE